MPMQDQHPLSLIRIDIHAIIPPYPSAPPGTPTLVHSTGFQMWYAESDTWYGETTFDPENPASVYTWATVVLDWNVPSTFIQIQVNPNELSQYPGLAADTTIGPCDSTSPWDTTWVMLNTTTPGQAAEARAHRNASPLAPLLPMFVSSPTVHGPIGDHCVFRGPLYPEGAIYGETPPNSYGTRMRLRPRNVIYTDTGHATRRLNFQSAGSQWQALTAGQQADWNTAARSVKPTTTGYALWTQIIATRRTDRIPTLNARIGKTLIVPDFPT